MKTTSKSNIFKWFLIMFTIVICCISFLNDDAFSQSEWAHAYCGANNEEAYCVRQNTDGTYMAVGYTNSFGPMGDNIWVTKINASGDIAWQNAYGGDGTERGRSILATTDGGYIIAGATDSFPPSTDIWIVKLNATGEISWQTRFQAGGPAQANSIQPLSDGGYIVAGDSASFASGNKEAWVLRLDATGNILWQKRYGGTGSDQASFIQQTNDGGFIVAGNSYSYGAGQNDFWILKLDANGNIDNTCDFIYDTSIYPGTTSVSPELTTYGAAPPAGFWQNSISSPTVTNCTETLICPLALPGAVPDNDNYPGTPLTIAKSGINLNLAWSAPLSPCITADYGIYRGTFPWTGYTYASVTCSTSSATSATIASDTGSYYYLIFAQNAGSEGSFGVDSSDTQRPPANSPCLPQQIGSCN